MYIIDISKVDEVSFKLLNFNERDHLQEWVRKNPISLGEELLIIQKEFADFEGTNERLDLLAIDKASNLVLIENKLDDSGKDVVWQALKYTAYCSTLTTSDIINIYQKYLDSDLQTQDQDAADNISEFLDQQSLDGIDLNSDQRVILVAANFRKEVTSTVLWLINKGIDIKCIKVTPHKVNEHLLLTSDQIIPVPETEEYLIKMASKEIDKIIKRKTASHIEETRLLYWTQLLPHLKKFNNLSPSRDHWLSKGSGVSGIAYVIIFGAKFLRIELYIDTPSKENNKQIFNNILDSKIEIEQKFGNSLNWQELPLKRASRISFEQPILIQNDKEQWPNYNNFFIENEILFINTFSSVLGTTL